MIRPTFLAAERIDMIDTSLDIDQRVAALEQIAVSVKDAQRFDRRLVLGIMSVFVAAAIAFFTLTHSDISSIKTNLGILKDDVVILKNYFEIIKSDFQIIKSDFQIIKSDFQIIKSDFQIMKNNFVILKD